MRPSASDRESLFRVFNEIGIIAQLSSNLFERTLPEGMTVSQFSVLNHLVRLGDDHSPLRLARAFQVTKGAMTNTLQKLEASGLIRVEPDPTDGRAKRVFLTRKGRNRHRSAIEGLAPIGAALSRDLDTTKLLCILPILENLRAYLDENRDLHERV